MLTIFIFCIGMVTIFGIVFSFGIIFFFFIGLVAAP